jgi:hypothetical protein
MRLAAAGVSPPLPETSTGVLAHTSVVTAAGGIATPTTGTTLVAVWELPRAGQRGRGVERNTAMGRCPVRCVVTRLPRCRHRQPW